MKKMEAKKLYVKMNKDFILNKNTIECEVHYDMGVFMDTLCKNGDLTIEQYESMTYPSLRAMRKYAKEL